MSLHSDAPFGLAASVRAHGRGISRALARYHPTVTSGNAAVLPEILRRIVVAYRPTRIYLFGSEARGDAGEDSDLDLAVIVRDDAPEHEARPRIAAEVLWGLDRGADVVVLREADFSARRRVVASLPWIIEREGKLLYGA
jgi:predicted nucleotidyltransferase